MEIYDIENNDYKAYINVGGGLSSLGNAVNGKLLKPGINKIVKFPNCHFYFPPFLLTSRT
jgi:hypothetical protein